MAREFLPVAEPDLSGNELKYATECIKSTWISSIGEFITRFEKQFAQFCGVRHCIATSNGTTALHLILHCLGIGPGDEVIVPALTFVATANAVVYTGATPVFIDSEDKTWNIDVKSIEEKITSRTKAIIVVHLYGHPANMDPIIELAKGHNLIVIEDAAEAHGAEYKGKRVGGLAEFGCFSFYANKIITTGEGGAITTNSDEYAERLRFLRDHSMSSEKRYWHPELGFNYRITNLQAAIGVAQMERIDEFIQKKIDNAELYNSLLSDIKGITIPPSEPWAKNVYWMYSILIEESFGVVRDDVMSLLRKQGIDTRPFFYPLHTLPHYAGGRERLPVAEEIATKGINLPSATTLQKEDIVRIADAIRKIKG